MNCCCVAAAIVSQPSYTYYTSFIRRRQRGQKGRTRRPPPNSRAGTTMMDSFKRKKTNFGFWFCFYSSHLFIFFQLGGHHRPLSCRLCHVHDAELFYPFKCTQTSINSRTKEKVISFLGLEGSVINFYYFKLLICLLSLLVEMIIIDYYHYLVITVFIIVIKGNGSCWIYWLGISSSWRTKSIDVSVCQCREPN